MYWLTGNFTEINPSTPPRVNHLTLESVNGILCCYHYPTSRGFSLAWLQLVRLRSRSLREASLEVLPLDTFCHSTVSNFKVKNLLNFDFGQAKGSKHLCVYVSQSAQSLLSGLNLGGKSECFPQGQRKLSIKTKCPLKKLRI